MVSTQRNPFIVLLTKFCIGIHDILGRSSYAVFHGHRTTRDFVEAPSQLLEYWCWQAECLQRLSHHYSYLTDDYKQHWFKTRSSKAGAETQPPLKIPSDLVAKLADTRKVNQGILTLRQIAFSLFDLEVHHPKSHDDLKVLDLDKTYNSLLQDLTLMDGPAECDWGHGYATTSHFIWGQESNYFSYIL